MFLDHLVVPLVGFNLGIEAGQVVVLGLAALCLWASDRVLGGWSREAATIGFRRRVVLVSLAAGLVASGMALDRMPR
jgi:hypothetical protein